MRSGTIRNGTGITQSIVGHNTEFRDGVKLKEGRVVTSTNEEQVGDKGVPELQDPSVSIIRKVSDGQVSTNNIAVTVAGHGVRLACMSTCSGNKRGRIFQVEGLSGSDRVQRSSKMDEPLVTSNNTPRPGDSVLLRVLLVVKVNGTIVVNRTASKTQVVNTVILLLVDDFDETLVIPVG